MRAKCLYLFVLLVLVTLFVPLAEAQEATACRTTCAKLLDSGMGDQYSAVVKLSRVDDLVANHVYQHYPFAGFHIYGTPEQIKLFISIVDELRTLGAHTELLRRISSPQFYEKILLSDHPGVLIGGTPIPLRCSVSGSSNSTSPIRHVFINGDNFYIIEIDMIAKHFPACSQEALQRRSTNNPDTRQGSTQCGILAHELVEAAMAPSRQQHMLGIEMQNLVRRLLGNSLKYSIDWPIRVEAGEKCATQPDSVEECHVVFEYGLIEVMRRKCDNAITSITHHECADFGKPSEKCLPPRSH